MMFLLLSLVGQPGGTSGPISRAMETMNVLCPQGHAVAVNGRWDGDVFHAYFRRPGSKAVPAPLLRQPYPTGVVTERMPHHGGREWFGGNTGYAPAVGANGDRPNRLHLTIIGSQVEREAAKRDLVANPEFQRLQAEMGDNLAFQMYDPSNPLVAEIGLPDGGRPDVVVQTTKGGRVAYRAHSYPGADVVVNEIRRADPSYSPAKDPGGGGLDLNADLAAWVAELGVSPAEIIACVAVVVLFVVALRKGAL